ncbi:MAG: hypothetical protein H0W72_00115 [Planctomycetes bacterium]|nr:hypothetical protein [Planctomycetota bacterium]
MVYRDAPHVDVGSFYARNPCWGKIYRLLGYIGIAAAVALHDDADAIAKLLVVVVVVWLAAWYQIVGTLWRSSLVAAALLCAVTLTLHRTGVIL